MNYWTVAALVIGAVLGAIAVVIVAVLYMDYKEMKGWFTNDSESEVSEGHTSD